MRIGIALSGGGLRAAVFHMGVLARLACESQLENVTFLSSVSGGSLGIGLLMATNECCFPSSHEYLDKVLPRVRHTLTSIDLGIKFISTVLTSPRRIFGRTANDFALSLQEFWGLDFSLNQLPPEPRWAINSTCHETGKNWRFMRKRMGDNQFGYVFEPHFPISGAVAASSALPMLMGHYSLKTSTFSWEKYLSNSTDETEPIRPLVSSVHLWDGAFYDNLGLEALFKPTGIREGVDFVIVSDASVAPAFQKYGWGFPLSTINRLKDISLNRSLSLYSRYFVNFLDTHVGSGCYLKIGNSAKYLLTQTGNDNDLQKLSSIVLSDDEVTQSKYMELTIKKLTEREFDRLLKHGFEVANCTLYGYHSTKFKLYSEYPFPC